MDPHGSAFEVKVFSERRGTGFAGESDEWEYPLGLNEQALAEQKFEDMAQDAAEYGMEAERSRFDEHGRFLVDEAHDDFETRHCPATGGQITMRRADAAAAGAYFGSRVAGMDRRSR